MMMILLVYMPFAYGGASAFSEEIIVGLAGLMALCLAGKLIFDAESEFVWSWVYVPVGLFVGLALFQLFPLPAWVVSLISPNTAAIKRELLADVPGSASILQRMHLTFYPWATRHDLRILLAVCVVFVVTLNTYRRTVQIKRLLTGITLIGAAVALFALYQFLAGSDTIYGDEPLRSASGPFINHSHFGQFINLSIGAALGLIFATLQPTAGKRGRMRTGSWRRLSQGKIQVLWGLTAMVILGACTICLSMTRGGIIAMLAAGAVTAIVLALSRRSRGRSSIVLIVALLAFLVLLFLGFDAVYNRIATLSQLDQAQGMRTQILKDLVQAYKKFPLFGTGLGTHESVFPMFDTSVSDHIAAHAENEYAQLAEETGLAGVVLCLAFLGAVAWSYRRSLRNVTLPIQAAAYGLGFGLLAILIHSMSDFGQHLPANACLTAVFSALMLTLAGRGEAVEDDKVTRWQGDKVTNTDVAAPSGEVTVSPGHQVTGSSSSASSVTLSPGHLVTWSSPPLPLWHWFLRVGAALLIGLVFTWAVMACDAARRADDERGLSARDEAVMEEINWKGSNEDYAALLRHAEAAVELDPRNVKYRYMLNSDRWRSITREIDPDTGNLVMTERSLGFARRIADEIHLSRFTCPTYGMNYTLAGQIESTVLGDPSGEGHIRRGYGLSSYDPVAALWVGWLDVARGNWDQSMVELKKAMGLGANRQEVLDLYLRADRRDLALTLAKDDYEAMLHVADALDARNPGDPVAAEARSEALLTLQRQCDEASPKPESLAQLAGIRLRERDYSAAIELYRKALDSSYDNIGWRFNLAQALAQAGQNEQAKHEARICLRFRPQWAAAKQLIGDLSVRPRSANN